MNIDLEHQSRKKTGRQWLPSGVVVAHGGGQGCVGDGTHPVAHEPCHISCVGPPICDEIMITPIATATTSIGIIRLCLAILSLRDLVYRVAP